MGLDSIMCDLWLGGEELSLGSLVGVGKDALLLSGEGEEVTLFFGAETSESV